MKTTTLITLGALIGTCTFAHAQDKPKRPDGPKHEIPGEVREKYDVDQNGKLSEDEKNAMHEQMKAKMEERKAKMLAKYDTDKDGQLSDAEKEAMRVDTEAIHKALLEKYDADKNGKLDRAEMKAARDAGEELPMMRPGSGGKRGPGGSAPAPAPAPAPAAPAPAPVVE